MLRWCNQFLYFFCFSGSYVVVAVKYALKMFYCLKLGDKYHTYFIDFTALKRKFEEAELNSKVKLNRFSTI